MSVEQTACFLHLVATVGGVTGHHTSATVLRVVFEYQPLDVAQLLVQIVKPAFRLYMYRIPFRFVILVENLPPDLLYRTNRRIMLVD